MSEDSVLEKSESPVPYPRDDIIYESSDSSTLNLICGELFDGICVYDGVHAELAITGDSDVLENHAITLGKSNYRVQKVTVKLVQEICSRFMFWKSNPIT